MRILLFLLLIFITKFSQGQVNVQQDYLFQFNTKIELLKFENLISESYHLTRSWAFIEKIADTPNKLRFLEIKEKDFKHSKDTLRCLSKLQEKDFQNRMASILLKSDILISFMSD